MHASCIYSVRDNPRPGDPVQLILIKYDWGTSEEGCHSRGEEGLNSDASDDFRYSQYTIALGRIEDFAKKNISGKKKDPWGQWKISRIKEIKFLMDNLESWININLRFSITE